MVCEHKTLRCTDNVFYCCVCGARIDFKAQDDKQQGQEEKPAETAKKAVKRKKKEDK